MEHCYIVKDYASEARLFQKRTKEAEDKTTDVGSSLGSHHQLRSLLLKKRFIENAAKRGVVRARTLWDSH